MSSGNDLARVLRWGPGYSGGEDPNTLLRDVIDAEEVRLDRWTVVFHPDDKAAEVDFNKAALPNSQGEVPPRADCKWGGGRGAMLNSGQV